MTKVPVSSARRTSPAGAGTGVGAGARRGWTLGDPLAISADGDTIVGLGVDPRRRGGGAAAHRR